MKPVSWWNKTICIKRKVSEDFPPILHTIWLASKSLGSLFSWTILLVVLLHHHAHSPLPFRLWKVSYSCFTETEVGTWPMPHPRPQRMTEAELSIPLCVFSLLEFKDAVTIQFAIHSFSAECSNTPETSPLRDTALISFVLFIAQIR